MSQPQAYGPRIPPLEPVPSRTFSHAEKVSSPAICPKMDNVQRVLLIEDDPVFRALLAALLRAAGAGQLQIKFAEDLTAGLRIIDESSPDVIVADLNLPDSLGLDTVARLQEHSPNIPVVVLSGMEQESVAVKALHYGAQDYLCKSLVDGDQLRRSLRYAFERKQTDISLRYQRDFAEGLIENAEAIILLTDVAGRILRMNGFAAQITGVDDLEVLGDDWGEVLLPPEQQSFHREYMREIISSSTTQYRRTELLTRRKQRLAIRWAGRAIRNDDGHIEYVLLTGHDVTELEQAQQRMLQAERLATIGRTMIGLAHESRNALQRSQACLSMLERVTRNVPQAVAYIARLQKAQDDLRCIHDDLRDMAQPMRLKLELVNLRDVVEEGWSQLEEAREGRDASLAIEQTDCDPVCQLDRFRMQQVFRNLCENSLSVCPDPVRLTVRWSDEPQAASPAVQVAVQDNGPGFTPEQRQKAFEIFYTSKPNGTGLGLAIAKRIVETHGGNMWLPSENVAGATILFTLLRRAER